MSKLIAVAYAPLLAGLKARVRAAQVTAAVNRELMRLCWHIGRAILWAQRAEGWGGTAFDRRHQTHS